MSGLVGIIVGAMVVAIVALILQARRTASERANFRVLATLAAFAKATTVNLDIGAASEGFFHVMTLRRANHETDLEQFASGNAQRFIDEEGYTPEQALSAHWGGVLAIKADQRQYQHGIDSYDDTVNAMGRHPVIAASRASDQAKAKLRSAAMMQITMHLLSSPHDFNTFLRERYSS